MIRHIVLWKLKDQAEGASREQNIKHMRALLEALPGVISEIKGFEVGQNTPRDETAYDLALYSTFASREALQVYIEHPEHQKVVRFVRAVTAQRALVDYEF
jgi:heme-degrading monooxygenase HmoA